MLKVYEKAKTNGKKAGDSIQTEFDEMLQIDPGAVTFIGQSTDDIDLMTGNLRELGVKVTNLNEIERQKKI
jgi:hypothetical protein